jgi:hypothetical protein
MGNDPTLEFLSRLNDDSQWEIRRGIPIFESHTRVGADGKEIGVSDEELQEIADRANWLLSSKGIPGRVTDRHTMRVREDGKGMEPVPGPVKLYGFQVNYRVAHTGLDQKKRVVCDWKLYPQYAAEADKSPYRSVEYQQSLKLIRGTAAMMIDPFLDMGMVVFSDDARDMTIYSMGAGKVAEEKEKKPPEETPKPDQKPEPKPGEEKPGEAKNPEAKPGEEQQKPEGEQPTPEEAKLFDKMCSYMRTKYNLGEEWPASKSPEQTPGEQPGEKKQEIITPMQTTVTPEQYSALQARVQGIELERDQERCRNLLAEGLLGYSLSDAERQKELVKLTKIPAAERAERVTELQAIYAERKVPEGQLGIYSGHVEPGSKQVADSPHTAPWFHEPAMQYMRDHPGMQYDAACEHVKAQKAK